MAKTFTDAAPERGFWSVLDDLNDHLPGSRTRSEERAYTSPQSGPLGGIRHFPALSQRATILVVDDESSIAELIGEVLDAEGYRVLLASNGRAALTIAQREHPALVITDRMMPEIDGIEFVRLLYRQPALRDIPIVIMSSTRPTAPADDQTVSLNDALDRLASKRIPGVSIVTVADVRVGFLEKPFDIDALVDLVGTVTDVTDTTGRPPLLRH